MSSPYWFQLLAKRGRKLGITNADARTAREWFRAMALRIRGVSTSRLMTETPSRLFSRWDESVIGSMICFSYDPKTKKKMPYYDEFPLVFPIEPAEGGFLGINLHYLPHMLRARLMDALYTTAITQNDKVVRLRIGYGILKGASRFRAFRPCIKHYLHSQMRSKFFYVAPNEWDMALMMPLERFQKASTAKVWADSRRQIGG